MLQIVEDFSIQVVYFFRKLILYNYSKSNRTQTTQTDMILYLKKLIFRFFLVLMLYLSVIKVGDKFQQLSRQLAYDNLENCKMFENLDETYLIKILQEQDHSGQKTVKLLIPKLSSNQLIIFKEFMLTNDYLESDIFVSNFENQHEIDQQNYLQTLQDVEFLKMVQLKNLNLGIPNLINFCKTETTQLRSIKYLVEYKNGMLLCDKINNFSKIGVNQDSKLSAIDCLHNKKLQKFLHMNFSTQAYKSRMIFSRE